MGILGTSTRTWNPKASVRRPSVEPGSPPAPTAARVDLTQHLPDILDRVLHVDLLLCCTEILLLIATGDRPRSSATHLLHLGLRNSW
jgi:hypothetical protein